MKITYLLDAQKKYDCHIAIAINRHVSLYNSANAFWGRIDGVDELGILSRNIKEDLLSKKRKAAVTPIEVFEFDINESILNIWHLKYNGERDYLVTTIIDI